MLRTLYATRFPHTVHDNRDYREAYGLESEIQQILVIASLAKDVVMRMKKALNPLFYLGLELVGNIYPCIKDTRFD